MIDIQIQNTISRIRTKIFNEDYPTQRELNDISISLLSLQGLHILEASSENLQLMNKDGSAKDLIAPRWLCHLIGLRHRCVHIILQWENKMLGNVFIFQVRSPTKQHASGQIDVSVGGHVKAGNGSEQTAFLEINEELGLSKNEIKDQMIQIVSGYEFYNENPKENFYNTEWRDIYTAKISTNKFDLIQFKDKEVAGIFLCPIYEARRLITQKYIPITSSLEYSLPYFLENY